MVQALLEQAAKEEAMPEQVHFQGQSGGDKYRLTLLVSIAREGWFQGGQPPKQHLLPFVLLVPCTQHTRLEDLTSRGKFNKEVQYRGPDNSLIIRQKGPACQGQTERMGPVPRGTPRPPLLQVRQGLGPAQGMAGRDHLQLALGAPQPALPTPGNPHV